MPRDPHHFALWSAAQRLGVVAEDLAAAWGVDAARYGGVVVLKGRVVPGLSHQASLLADHKPAAKEILAAAGLAVPGGVALTGDPRVDGPAVEALLARGGIVVKPVDGTHGEGIALGLPTVDAALAHAAALGRPALVEALISGQDLRLHAIGGRLVAACVRTPPFVVGDGTATVRTLAARLDVEVQRPNPNNRVHLDDHTRAVLAEQGLDPDAVPAPGQVVQLGRLANMARGARATDVTDHLHPRWAEWVARAGAALGVTVFAVDALTVDPAADPAAVGAAIIEVNARPEWLHHTFSAGRTHDIGALLLQHLGVDQPRGT